MDDSNGTPKNRTNVRFPIIQRALRLFFKATAALSPGLAGRWAAKLFVTPRRHPRPARERALLAMGTPLSFQWKGEPLMCWSWGSGPTVLLVHGWEGRGAQLGAFVEPLVASGHRVVAFDGPAHGDSPGAELNLVIMSQLVAQVARATGAVALIAHSFGTGAALLALARGDLSIKRVALLAAMTDVEGVLSRYEGFVGLDATTAAAFRTQLAERVGVPAESVDPLASGPPAGVDILAVHDRGDAEVPFADAEALAAAWPSARLVETHGLGHRRLLRDRDVVRLVSAFVTGAHRLPTALLRTPVEALEHDLFDREARRERIFG